MLKCVNAMANRLVAASGVTPVERAAAGGQDADTIRQLVEHSASAGALDDSFRSPISGALGSEHLDIGALVDSAREPTAVPAGATVAEVQEAAARTGHIRILLLDEDLPTPEVIHVRDTLMESADALARPFSRPVMMLDVRTPAYEALGEARERSEQLAVVTERGRFVGVVTISDILKHLLPEDARHAAASPER